MKIRAGASGVRAPLRCRTDASPLCFALGQVAGTAAAQALSEGVAVQDVDYRRLRDRLEQDGQILSLK